jgi:restriction endonuclease Mrr
VGIFEHRGDDKAQQGKNAGGHESTDGSKPVNGEPGHSGPQCRTDELPRSHPAVCLGGVFVTTSDFTDGARKAASETPKHIALINGHELGKSLIKYEVGVRFPKVHREVELDESYFEGLLD